jgi:hypothetical protein
MGQRTTDVCCALRLPELSEANYDSVRRVRLGLAMVGYLGALVMEAARFAQRGLRCGNLGQLWQRPLGYSALLTPDIDAGIVMEGNLTI